MHKIQEVKTEYKKVFYLEDDGVLDVTLALALSIYLKRDPVWLLIVGASSGGKTELINIFTELPNVHEVDELTESTFLSGMRTGGGKTASLLESIGSVGMIVMKDFTSILTMRQDKREILLGQMRQIYDGKFNKKTGNGENPSWSGKITFLGGVTDAVYTVGEQSADMGRRTINYVLPQQDRQKTAAYARRNKKEGSMQSKREHLKKVVNEFVNNQISEMPEQLPPLEPELTRTISLLCDFATQARTPVKRNYRGEIILVDDFEMPMRVDEQVQTIASTMQFMYGGELGEKEKRTIYKLALDSIPKQRRLVLNNLAEFDEVSATGLAEHLNYPTETVIQWLYDLNAVQVVNRKSVTFGPIKWSLPENFRTYMHMYGGVKPKVGESLLTIDDYGGTNFGDKDLDPGLIREIMARKEKEADDFFESL